MTIAKTRKSKPKAKPTASEIKSITPLPPKGVLKPKFKQFTVHQWAEIDAMWKSGEVTIDELVKNFGGKPETFKRSFGKRGVIRGASKEEIKQRVMEELAKAQIADAALIAGRVRETKEDHYKMAAGIAKLTWSEVLKARQEGHPVAVALPNLKALEAAMTILKKAREERYSVLGLDRDDSVDPSSLPELVISELTPDQVTHLQSRNAEDGLEQMPDADIAVEEIPADGSG